MKAAAAIAEILKRVSKGRRKRSYPRVIKNTRAAPSRFSRLARQASDMTRSWKSGARPSPYLTKRHCSNYTSRQFAGTLREYNLRQSVGRTGIYDNAMAESFFAALKNERVHWTSILTGARVPRRCEVHRILVQF